jgi:hypothetical protein
MRQPVLYDRVWIPNVVMLLSCGICKVRGIVPARAPAPTRARHEFINALTKLRLPI